jgi:hypothetical protein
VPADERKEILSPLSQCAPPSVNVTLPLNEFGHEFVAAPAENGSSHVSYEQGVFYLESGVADEKDPLRMDIVAFSFALAQSVNLAVWEETVRTLRPARPPAADGSRPMCFARSIR